MLNDITNHIQSIDESSVDCKIAVRRIIFDTKFDKSWRLRMKEFKRIGFTDDGKFKFTNNIFNIIFIVNLIFIYIFRYQYIKRHSHES